MTTLESALSEDSGFVYLARFVDDQVAQAVQNLDLEGINILPATRAGEPSAPLAVFVVRCRRRRRHGGVGTRVPVRPASFRRERNLDRRGIPFGVVLPDAAPSGSPGQNGDGIELTLDEPLQYVAERALSSALVSSHAISGTVVVMDVHTGDILAMANLVSNAATKQVREAASEPGVTNVYEPGSVFKLVTFSAALQAGTIAPTSELTIPPYMDIDGSVFHDAEEHGTEQLSATQVLAQSSNLGTIEMARKLGHDEDLRRDATPGHRATDRARLSRRVVGHRGASRQVGTDRSCVHRDRTEHRCHADAGPRHDELGGGGWGVRACRESSRRWSNPTALFGN